MKHEKTNSYFQKEKRTRQRNILDPQFQERLEWLEQNWREYFSIASTSSTLSWTQSRWRDDNWQDDHWKDYRWHANSWQEHQWWAVIELRTNVLTSFRFQKIVISLWLTGGVDWTPRRTHMFPVLVSLSSASHFFFLTHTRVWLKSQLASSVGLTVLKLSACHVKKDIHIFMPCHSMVFHKLPSHSVRHHHWPGHRLQRRWLESGHHSALLRGWEDSLVIWPTPRNPQQREVSERWKKTGRMLSVESKRYVHEKETHAVSATMRVEVNYLRALPLLL